MMVFIEFLIFAAFIKAYIQHIFKEYEHRPQRILDRLYVFFQSIYIHMLKKTHAWDH